MVPAGRAPFAYRERGERVRLIVGLTLFCYAVGAVFGALAATHGLHVRGEGVVHGWWAFWPVALVTAYIPVVFACLVLALAYVFGGPVTHRRWRR